MVSVIILIISYLLIICIILQGTPSNSTNTLMRRALLHDEDDDVQVPCQQQAYQPHQTLYAELQVSGNKDDDYMIKHYFGDGGSAFDDDDEKYHYDHLKYYPLQELFTYSCASTKTSKQKTNHIKEEVPKIM